MIAIRIFVLGMLFEAKDLTLFSFLRMILFCEFGLLYLIIYKINPKCGVKFKIIMWKFLKVLHLSKK